MKHKSVAFASLAAFAASLLFKNGEVLLAKPLSLSLFLFPSLSIYMCV